MIEMIIYLNSITDIKNFVELTNRCEGQITVYSGQYIVDGKSIMGIFSLDLSKPIKVEFDEKIPSEIKDDLQKFMAKE